MWPVESLEGSWSAGVEVERLHSLESLGHSRRSGGGIVDSEESPLTSADALEVA